MTTAAGGAWSADVRPPLPVSLTRPHCVLATGRRPSWLRAPALWKVPFMRLLKRQTMLLRKCFKKNKCPAARLFTRAPSAPQLQVCVCRVKIPTRPPSPRWPSRNPEDVLGMRVCKVAGKVVFLAGACLGRCCAACQLSSNPCDGYRWLSGTGRSSFLWIVRKVARRHKRSV